MATLKKISEETLAKASALTQKQMSTVVGGGTQPCGLRCNQDQTEYYIPVDDCDGSTIITHCTSLDKIVCSCSGLEN